MNKVLIERWNGHWSFIFIFLLAFLLASFLIDIYYLNKVSIKSSNPPWEISYSDFKVFHDTANGFYFRYPGSGGYGPVDIRYGPIYDFQKDFYHFRYSPFAVFLFLPFARIPAGIALLIWSFIANILFLCSILFLRYIFDKSHTISRNLKIAFSFIVSFLVLRPYLNVIALGQTDIFIAFLLVLVLLFYLNGMQLIGGITFALILHFKPFFFPILLYFALSGKWRLSLATVIAFPAFLAIPMIRPGYRQEFFLLIHAWMQMMGHSVSSQLINPKNESFLYMILKSAKVAGNTNIVYLTSGVLQLLFIAALLWWSKKIDSKKKYAFSTLEISYLIISILLCSPLVWKAALIYTVIPCAFIIYNYAYGIKNRISIFSLAAFFILTSILNPDILKYVPIAGIENLKFIPLGLLFLLASLLAISREAVDMVSQKG